MIQFLNDIWEHYLNNYIVVVTVVGTFAALIALLLQVRKRKLRAKPSVKECRATLRIHHSRNRSNDAEALVVNSGEKSCYITKMRLLSDVFDLETVRISFDSEVAYGISGRGDEIPLQLNGNEEKRVYMRTQELVEQYKGQLPNTVKVYIEFDSKPLIKTLTKDGDRSVYLFK